MYAANIILNVVSVEIILLFRSLWPLPAEQYYCCDSFINAGPGLWILCGLNKSWEWPADFEAEG